MSEGDVEMTYLAVIIGGVIGGILRYALGFIPLSDTFPLDTLAVNLIGCFGLGLFYGIADLTGLKAWFRTGIGTGVIGAFTTFSTFCLDGDRLARIHFGLAVLYLGSTIIGGPVLACLGHQPIVFFAHRGESTSKELSA
jgi:fluoride exporter